MVRIISEVDYGLWNIYADHEIIAISHDHHDNYGDDEDNYDDPTVIVMIIMICGKSGCVPNEARPGPRLGPAHMHHTL